MFQIPRLHQWHWPHLGLLVLLPLLAAVSIAFGLDHRWILFLWLIINIVVLAAAEHARPYRNDWRADSTHVKRDVGLWSVNLLTDAVIGALLAAMMLILAPDITSLTLTWQITIGLLLAELGSYWLHRLSHSDGWLWRVHLLHHRPNQVNVANALTLHPINMIYNKLARLLPLLMLGLSADAILVVAMFELTQALVTHANIAGRMGPLNLVLGSAELHRLHHSTEATDAGNFGTSLPIWDQLFGTYRAGSAPKTVGVFDHHAYPGALETCTLLTWPFSAKRATCLWREWRCCRAQT